MSSIYFFLILVSHHAKKIWEMMWTFDAYDGPSGVEMVWTSEVDLAIVLVLGHHKSNHVFVQWSTEFFNSPYPFI